MNQFQSRNTVKSGSNLYRKYNNKSYSFDITDQQLKNLQIGYNFKKKKGKRSSETQGFKHLDGTSSKNMDSLLRLTQMNDLDLLGNILQTGQYIEDMKFAIVIEDKITGKRYAKYGQIPSLRTKNYLKGLKLSLRDTKLENYPRISKALLEHPDFMKKAYGFETIPEDECWLNAIIEEYAILHPINDKKLNKYFPPWNYSSELHTKYRSKDLDLTKLNHMALRELLEKHTGESFYVDGKVNESICTFENMIEIFFKPRKLEAYLLDRNLKQLESFTVEKRAHKIHPTNFFIYDQQHIYCINDHIRHKFKDFKPKMADYRVDHSIERFCLFPMPAKETKAVNTESLMCRSFEEVFDALQTDPNAEIRKIVFTGNMTDLHFYLLHAKRMNGYPYMDGDQVRQIAFNHGGKMQTHIRDASHLVDCDEPGMSQFKDIESYTSFYEAWNDARQSILSSTHMSIWDQETLEVFKRLRRANNRGCGSDNSKVNPDDVIQIDFNKYYPDILMNMPSIPVLQGCEKFQVYKGEPIEDMCCYIIQIIMPEELIYSKQEICTSWGINLKSMMQYTDIEIHSYLRPAYLKPNHFKSSMKKIWFNDKLTAPQKKRIANLQIGMLGKTSHVSHKSELCFDEAEANLKEYNRGGRVTKGKISNTVKELCDEDCCNEYFVWEDSTKYTLNSGFYPIQDYIYDTARRKLFDLVQMCSKFGKVCAINTDCVYVQKSTFKLKEFQSKYSDLADPKWSKRKNTFDSIGKLKIDTANLDDISNVLVQNDPVYNIPYRSDSNLPQLSENQAIDFNYTEVENEWNVTKLNHRQAVFGKYPGVGKTHTACNAFKNPLIITPWNSLRCDLAESGRKVMTVNSLFGMGPADRYPQKHTYKELLDGVDGIVFDEIMLNSLLMLIHIKKFCADQKDIPIICTGDENQLEPVDTQYQNNIKDKAQYNLQIVKCIFPDCIVLKEVKRCCCSKHKAMDRGCNACITEQTFATEFYEKIKCSINVVEAKKIIYSTLKTTVQIDNLKNVCYTNDTKNRVNNHIHFKHLKLDKCFVGFKIVCYNPLNSKTTNRRINKNTIWIVTSIKDDIVFESVDGERTLSQTDFENHMTYNYAGTVHSYQGRSEDQPMTLFEIDNKYVTKNWLYVAVSRSRHPTQMSIYSGSLAAVKSGYDIKSHKCTDFKKGFEWDDCDYVDDDWAAKVQFIDQLNICSICKSSINVASIDRICNSLPHVKSNCQIVCLNCNKSKK